MECWPHGFIEALRAELVDGTICSAGPTLHPLTVNTPYYSHAGLAMKKGARPSTVLQPETVYLAET